MRPKRLASQWVCKSTEVSSFFWFLQLPCCFFGVLQQRYLSLGLLDSSSLCLTRLTSWLTRLTNLLCNLRHMWYVELLWYQVIISKTCAVLKECLCFCFFVTQIQVRVFTNNNISICSHLYCTMTYTTSPVMLQDVTDKCKPDQICPFMRVGMTTWCICSLAGIQATRKCCRFIFPMAQIQLLLLAVA